MKNDINLHWETKGLLSIFVGILIFIASLSRAESQNDPGISADEITIGGSMPVSGPNSQLAHSFKEGADLFFKRINGQGGVHSRKIKYIVRDDKGEPKIAKENVEKLAQDDHVFAVFQVYGAPAMRASIQFTKSIGIPVIAPLSGAGFLRGPESDSVYNIRASDYEEAKEMIKYLKQVRQIKDISLLDQDDAFGEAGKNAFHMSLRDYDLKRASEGIYYRNSPDLAKAITQIRAANPKAVVMWVSDDVAASFIQACVKQGFKPLFFVSSTATTAGFLKQISKLDVEVYATESVPFITGRNSNFMRLFNKDCHEAKMEGSPPVFEGYLNSAFMVEILKRLGPSPRRAKIKNVVESLSDLDLDDIHLKFGAGVNQGWHNATLVKVKFGKLNYMYYF